MYGVSSQFTAVVCILMALVLPLGMLVRVIIARPMKRKGGR
jgi:hypothetical protein